MNPDPRSYRQVDSVQICNSNSKVRRPAVGILPTSQVTCKPIATSEVSRFPRPWTHGSAKRLRHLRTHLLSHTSHKKTLCPIPPFAKTLLVLKSASSAASLLQKAIKRQHYYPWADSLTMGWGLGSFRTENKHFKRRGWKLHMQHVHLEIGLLQSRTCVLTHACTHSQTE